jgi:copper transport protein
MSEFTPLIDQAHALRVSAGQVTDGPEFLEIVARLMTIASLLVLVGAAAFVMVVWWPVLGSDRSAARDVAGSFARRARRIGSFAWLGAVAGTAASLLLLIRTRVDEADHSSVLAALTSEVVPASRSVLSTLLRLLGLVLAAALWASRGRRALLEMRAGSARLRSHALTMAVVTALALGLLTTAGLSGHAAERSPAAVNVAASALHLGAAACWIGGLLMLVFAVYPATSSLAHTHRVRVLAPAVSRFSSMAVIAVGLLVASGLFRSWEEVRTVEALTGTDYGVTLLSKVAAFAPMLGLGGFNRLWLKPRLERAASSPEAPGAPVVSFKRLMSLELALAAVVLALTAALTDLSPPAR